MMTMKSWDLCRTQQSKSPLDFLKINSCFPDKAQCLRDQELLSSNYSDDPKRYWGAKMTDLELFHLKTLREGKNNTKVSEPSLGGCSLAPGGKVQASSPSRAPTSVSSHCEWVSRKRSLWRRQSGPGLQGLSTAILMHALVLATQEAEAGEWLQPRV